MRSDPNLKRQMLLKNLADTKKLAEQLADLCAIEEVIGLKGDLGSGKTEFARHFIRHIALEDPVVQSPTFNLVHVYKTVKGTIWHFDLYRLQAAKEVFELGIEDAMSFGISLIEWPEIIQDILPENYLEINFSFTESDNARYVDITAYGGWHAKLLKLWGE